MNIITYNIIKINKSYIEYSINILPKSPKNNLMKIQYQTFLQM